MLLSCVGIVGEMEACTEYSSVRFKQRTVTGILTVEGVTANETGIRTTMTVENEMGNTAQRKKNTVIPTRKRTGITKF